MSAQSPKHIFISYSRKDYDFVNTLKTKLEQNKLNVWLDTQDMESDFRTWRSQLEKAIRASRQVLFCISPDSLASETVIWEIDIARRNGICVQMVMVEPYTVKDVKLMRWMRKRHIHSVDDNNWQPLLRDLQQECSELRVPTGTIPHQPAHYVSRPTETEQLIALLLDEKRENPVVITTALQGGGGFGKTTLAGAICRDPRIQQTFDEGILWIMVGKEPDMEKLLNAEIRRLKPGSLKETENAAAITLGNLLEGRDILVVIDDVWMRHHVNMLTQSKSTTYLITTRQRDIVSYTKAKSVKVDEMQPNEAVELLSRWLENISNGDHQSLRKLGARLGEWALLLELVGAELRALVETGRTLDEAIDFVNKRLTRKGFTYLDRANEDNRNFAVSISIDASLELLPKEYIQRFYELGIFGRGNWISFSYIEYLWSVTANYDKEDTEDGLEALHRLSLFMQYDATSKMLLLHDVICAVIQERLYKQEIVRSAIEDMDIDHRVVIVLGFFANIGISDIAEILDADTNIIEERLHRAIALLVRAANTENKQG